MHSSMLSKASISVATITILMIALVFATPVEAADPCDTSVLPQEVQTNLQKNYADWQPERLENLYEDDRGFWLKAHPNDCPGIANWPL